MAANKKEEFTFEIRLEHFQKLKVWKCVRVYKCTVGISWFRYWLLSLKWTTSEKLFFSLDAGACCHFQGLYQERISPSACKRS